MDLKSNHGEYVGQQSLAAHTFLTEYLHHADTHKNDVSNLVIMVMADLVGKIMSDVHPLFVQKSGLIDGGVLMLTIASSLKDMSRHIKSNIIKETGEH